MLVNQNGNNGMRFRFIEVLIYTDWQGNGCFCPVPTSYILGTTVVIYHITLLQALIKNPV